MPGHYDTMNLYTFKDATTSKRSSLANEIENLDDGDDDDAEEGQMREARGAVDGEEEAGGEKVPHNSLRALIELTVMYLDSLTKPERLSCLSI